MKIAIDNMCLKLLALRQPMAADFRFITSAMKIITDLERMGDQAVNIAEQLTLINSRTPAYSLTSIFPGWLRSPNPWSRMF